MLERHIRKIQLLILATGFAIGAAFAVSCAPGSKPDVFVGAVVDCAKVNPNNSGAASAVYACLAGALAQNPGPCLAGLVEVGHWTVDEVACIVAFYGQRSNEKLLAKQGGDEDRVVAKAAHDWLVQNKIAVQNTPGGW